MKPLQISLFIVFLFAFRAVEAQLGEVSLGLISLGHISIGSGRNIGVSTLPVCRARDVSCASYHIYHFTGNGHWSREENWRGNRIPPVLLPPGDVVIVAPEQGGECILDVVQTISRGALFDLQAGARLRVLLLLRFL